MAELIWGYVGSIVRAALVALSAWMVSRGILKPEQVDGWIVTALKDVMTVLPGIVSVIWSLIRKYQSQQLVATALVMPKGSSLSDAKALIAQGSGVAPSDIQQ